MPQLAIKSGMRASEASAFSAIGPKKISWSAKGTLAPEEMTSTPALSNWFNWSSVIMRLPAQGIKISAGVDQKVLLTAS